LYGCRRVKLLPTEDYGAPSESVYTLPTMLYRHYQTSWALAFTAYVVQVMPRVLPAGVREMGQEIGNLSRAAARRALSGAGGNLGRDAMDVDDESRPSSSYQQTYTGAAGGKGRGGHSKGHDKGRRDDRGKGWDSSTSSSWHPRSYAPTDSQGWRAQSDWRWSTDSTWDSAQTWESSPHR
jgi:hypothetical protein